MSVERRKIGILRAVTCLVPNAVMIAILVLALQLISAIARSVEGMSEGG